MFRLTPIVTEDVTSARAVQSASRNPRPGPTPAHIGNGGNQVRFRLSRVVLTMALLAAVRRRRKRRACAGPDRPDFGHGHGFGRRRHSWRDGHHQEHRHQRRPAKRSPARTGVRLHGPARRHVRPDGHARRLQDLRAERHRARRPPNAWRSAPSRSRSAACRKRSRSSPRPCRVQTTSGERSATITASQIEDIGLKGRDFMGSLKTAARRHRHVRTRRPGLGIGGRHVDQRPERRSTSPTTA